MLLTGPSSGTRFAGFPSTSRESIPSMFSTYQRPPSRQRSTSAHAAFHGLPISQASSSARSSRTPSIASIAALTRRFRSSRSTFPHSRWARAAARTASSAVAESTLSIEPRVVPSTGEVCADAVPTARHSPSIRFAGPSSANASVATPRARSRTACHVAYSGTARSGMTDQPLTVDDCPVPR